MGNETVTCNISGTHHVYENVSNDLLVRPVSDPLTKEEEQVLVEAEDAVETTKHRQA